MATLLGNTSAKSLLSAAKSAQSQMESLEDAEATYTWENSAKTQDDLNTYLSHLQSRQSEYKDTNPNKAFTYFSSQSAAHKAFTSSEIQRQNIGVVEGNLTDSDKLNKIGDLYKQSVLNGDEALSQSLRLQYDNLDKQIQTAAVAGARAAASSLASTASSNLSQMKDKLVGTPGVKETYTYTDGTGQPQLSLAGLENAVQTKGLNAFQAKDPKTGKTTQANLASLVLHMVNTIGSAYQGVAKAAPGTSAARTATTDYNDLVTNTLPKFGGLGLKYDEWQRYNNEAELSQPGHGPFSVKLTNDPTQPYKITIAQQIGQHFVTDQRGDAKTNPTFGQPVLVPERVPSIADSKEAQAQVKATDAAVKNLQKRGVNVSSKDGAVTLYRNGTAYTNGFLNNEGSISFQNVNPNTGATFRSLLGSDGKFVNESFQQEQAQAAAFAKTGAQLGSDVGSTKDSQDKTAATLGKFAEGSLFEDINNKKKNPDGSTQPQNNAGPVATADQLHQVMMSSPAYAGALGQPTQRGLFGGNTFGTDALVAHADQLKQAADLRQAQTIAAQQTASRLAVASLPGPLKVKAATPPPAPPASKLFLPSTGLSPAQNAQVFKKPTTDTQRAVNLGAAAGLNPNALLGKL